jgi:hypothetical protein
MPNHYHLLLRTKNANLSKAIQWLGVSYSVWFNKRHERSGHLFQGRFKSFIVENERYLAALAFYIHGNPVRASIADTPARYRWSSYHAYAGVRERSPWLVTGLILSLFGGNHESFRQEQQAHLGARISVLDDLRCGSFLGSEEFARACEAKMGGQAIDEKPQARLLLRAHGIEETSREIMTRLEGDVGGDVMDRKKRRRLRDVTILGLTRVGCFSNAEIGALYGIGCSGVTEAVKRGARYVAGDDDLRHRLGLETQEAGEDE